MFGGLAAGSGCIGVFCIFILLMIGLNFLWSLAFPDNEILTLTLSMITLFVMSIFTGDMKSRESMHEHYSTLMGTSFGLSALCALMAGLYWVHDMVMSSPNDKEDAATFCVLAFGLAVAGVAYLMLQGMCRGR